VSISDFKVADTTETGAWSRKSSASMGKRTRRQRSSTGIDHNSNALEKDKKTKKKENNYDRNNVAIFLEKTHDMISTCDPKLCEWTSNGDMFVVKNKAQFAMEVIPKYFNPIQFSSFVRQLNFYGFRKVQTQPVRKADIDEREASYVKFWHEHFKRDKKELLPKIHRSTRGGANTNNPQEQQRQIESLKEEIVSYEGEVVKLTDRVTFLEDKFCHIEKQCLALAQLQNFRSMKCKVEPDRISSIDGQKFSRGVSGTYLKHPSIKMNVPLTPNKAVYKCRPSFSHNNKLPNASHLISLPTLPPHHKTQSRTLPGSLRTERVLSREISVGRCLSNTSDPLPGLNNFDKNLFYLIMMDEKDDGQNKKGLDDGTITTFSSN